MLPPDELDSLPSVERLVEEAQQLAASGESFSMLVPVWMTHRGTPVYPHVAFRVLLDGVEAVGYEIDQSRRSRGGSEGTDGDGSGNVPMRFRPASVSDADTEDANRPDVHIAALTDNSTPDVTVRWTAWTDGYESMVAIDGVLFVVDMGTTAWDLSTGLRLWHLPVNADNPSSGGVQFGIDGHRLQVHSPDEYYIEVDRATGEKLAERSTPPATFRPIERLRPHDCSVADDDSVVGSADGVATWRIDLVGSPAVDTDLLAVDDLIVVAMSDERIVVLERSGIKIDAPPP